MVNPAGQGDQFQDYVHGVTPHKARDGLCGSWHFLNSLQQQLPINSTGDKNVSTLYNFIITPNNHICVFSSIQLYKYLHIYQPGTSLLAPTRTSQTHGFKIGRSRYPTASAWAVGLSEHRLLPSPQITIVFIIQGTILYTFRGMPRFLPNPNGKHQISNEKLGYSNLPGSRVGTDPNSITTTENYALKEDVQPFIIPSPSFRDCLPISTWPVERWRTCLKHSPKWGNRNEIAAFEGNMKKHNDDSDDDL